LQEDEEEEEEEEEMGTFFGLHFIWKIYLLFSF
jgi:hypothetical protein